MSADILLTSGGLASLFMEGIKVVVRMILKNPEYDFDPKFYLFMLPILNALTPFALVALGYPTNDPILSLDPVGVLKYILLIALSTLVSMFVNNTAISKFKQYRRTYALVKSEKEADSFMAEHPHA